MSNEPQPQNDIVALRTTLFDTMRALSDPHGAMDIDRAKAINEVAQTIINSAMVEVDALRIIGGNGSGFIPNNESRSGITHPKPGVTVHKLRG